MGACIRKRVVYDMSSKRFQFFVNVEALLLSKSLLTALFISDGNRLDFHNRSSV